MAGSGRRTSTAAKAWRSTSRWARRCRRAPGRGDGHARPTAGVGIAAAASRAASTDETRSASSSSGEVPGGHGSSDGPSSPAAAGRRRERRDPGRIESREPLDECPDRDAVRAVARLADGGLPAARQALAGAVAERLAQELVEERRRGRARWRSPRRRRARPGRAAAAGSSRASTAVSIASRAASWSGGRKRAIVAPKAIGVGSAQASRSISSGSSAATRSRKRASASAGSAGRCRTGGRGGAAALASSPRTSRPPVLADRPAQAALAVVAGAEIRVAQPVVGDVDPLRPLETGRAGDVRMVLSQERAPGDLDDLGARVDGDLEAGVQVVGGERRAWWHRPNPSGGGSGRPSRLRA